jgi:hypothetical protein
MAEYSVVSNQNDKVKRWNVLHILSFAYYDQLNSRDPHEQDGLRELILDITAYASLVKGGLESIYDYLTRKHRGTVRGHIGPINDSDLREIRHLQLQWGRRPGDLLSDRTWEEFKHREALIDRTYVYADRNSHLVDKARSELALALSRLERLRLEIGGTQEAIATYLASGDGAVPLRVARAFMAGKPGLQTPEAVAWLTRNLSPERIFQIANKAKTVCAAIESTLTTRRTQIPRRVAATAAPARARTGLTYDQRSAAAKLMTIFDQAKYADPPAVPQRAVVAVLDAIAREQGQGGVTKGNIIHVFARAAPSVLARIDAAVDSATRLQPSKWRYDGLEEEYATLRACLRTEEGRSGLTACERWACEEGGQMTQRQQAEVEFIVNIWDAGQRPEPEHAWARIALAVLGKAAPAMEAGELGPHNIYWVFKWGGDGLVQEIKDRLKEHSWMQAPRPGRADYAYILRQLSDAQRTAAESRRSHTSLGAELEAYATTCAKHFAPIEFIPNIMSINIQPGYKPRAPQRIFGVARGARGGRMG